MKNIQILVTDEEFNMLSRKADAVGLTVPLYVKSEILTDNDFSHYYQQLLEKVDNLQPKTRFTVKMLFGVEWTMDKGIKLNLGKTYYNKVSTNVIKNVKPIGKDSSNVMWYEKI